jgi:circadian clock protein KaiC
MTNDKHLPRIQTGVRNLDALFDGGIPQGSVVVVAGSPGTGKTVLTQQICFHNVSEQRPVLYFGTLSEPTAKTLRYMSQFTFFDAEKLNAGLRYADLGIILRADGLEATSALVMEQVRQVKPSIVVIDSFKVFDDLAKSKEELRKFGYEIAVNLMAWESTVFLLGEYGPSEIQSNPLFSIVDGLIALTQREESGEQQRFIQAIKMRGTHHSRDEIPFVMTSHGIEVFAPRITIKRDNTPAGEPRCKTLISKLDELLGDGIPRGSSLLIAGVAGTGKTLLLLEFIYRGAQVGEKGILFSFEETPERLLATSRSLGWDIEHEIAKGMIELVFIPQPEIMVEAHLLMMKERIEAMQARRVSVDSVSVFLHKIKDAQLGREKMFQLASVVQNARAVGFFATDVPYGSWQISRFGVEETVVDGVILLSSVEEGLERQRYLEIYKLRNTAHLKGRHNLIIAEGGITIFPRYNLEEQSSLPPAPIEASRRVGSGVSRLDELLGGGLLERSVTLVSGSAGIGKSTLALHFVAEGVKREQPCLYVALEEGSRQLLQTAEKLGLPLSNASDTGLLEIMYLSREHVRAQQFLAILADKIQAKGVRRLVLDSASHLVPDDVAGNELRLLLYALVTRFKALGVTSLLTLEASSMFSIETVTERGFSPLTDNLLMLRYRQAPGELQSTLTVVKTRGSPHDRGTYQFSIGPGGMSIGDRIDRPQALAPPRERGRTRQRPPGA